MHSISDENFPSSPLDLYSIPCENILEKHNEGVANIV